MADVYEFLAELASPLSLADAKAFLKVDDSTDDTLIQALIDACTDWGESYTGRDFRQKDWKLLRDEFSDRITLNRDPVASVTTVKYLVSDVLTTVVATTYYLKKLTQCSEILLADGQSWPTNIDDREQAIEIEFRTEGYYRQDVILEAIKRHVAYLYENRGDCLAGGITSGVTAAAANASMVTFIYDQFRISRV